MKASDLRDELHKQVQDSIAKGAMVLLGAEIPDGKGAFYPPTVLSDVKKGMPAYDEELFGPVAAIIPVKDEAEAIRVANDSIFGLGAAVFTEDSEKGERIATEELEAGASSAEEAVLLNTMTRTGAPPLENEWRGIHSSIEKFREAVMKDPETWKNFWDEHTKNKLPQPPVPDIDFDKKMVVAVIAGQKSTGGYITLITNIEQLPDKTVIYYTEQAPPQDAMLLQVITQPFHIKVIQKTDTPVTFKKTTP